MHAKPSSKRGPRLLGIAIGVGLAAVALAAWRVPGGERTLGADVRFEGLSSGAVGTQPAHAFISAPSLLPGSSSSGKLTLRNQTGVSLAVRLYALPSSRELDPLLQVRLAAGARAIYEGALGRLRAAGTRPLRLTPGESRRLQVRAALPAGLRSGFQARIVDVTLRIDARRTR